MSGERFSVSKLSKKELAGLAATESHNARVAAQPGREIVLTIKLSPVPERQEITLPQQPKQ